MAFNITDKLTFKEQFKQVTIVSHIQCRTRNYILHPTMLESFFLGDQFPQENTETVDIEFNSARMVDVFPDFRRSMSHSYCTLTLTLCLSQ